MQPQPLTDSPVPNLYLAQLDKFTPESIHSAIIMPFDVERAAGKLKAQEGSLVLGADFGGDKGTVRLFKIVNGRFTVVSDYADDIQGDFGDGYLATLERATAYAQTAAIPFGISWGGPIRGTKPLYHPKAETFLRELKGKYDGDIQAISPAITNIINDGPAGALSGAMAAHRQFDSHNTLFVINGGGINTSVVTGSTLYSDEAGHVQAIDELNSYGQTIACGVYGAEYVCLERIGANKAGIEPQWQNKMGSYMRARDIEDRYKAGDKFAGDLYEHSAWVVAHLLAGVAQATRFDLASADTAIVAHGGAFKFPHYGERVEQILTQHLHAAPQILLAKDYIADGSNACLEGAAIAAAYHA